MREPKRWAATIGAIASVALLLLSIWGGSGGERPDKELSGVFSETSFIPWENKSGEEGEQGAEELERRNVEAPGEMARWVRLVKGEGHGVEEEAMIGAPGLWPSITENTRPGGYLALPVHEARRMNGGALPFYEVLVRESDEEGRGFGFWGVVRSPEEDIPAEEARRIRMQEAASLEFLVVDDDGEPVEGAFLRLSRDSVGLLHLHYTTEKDGAARFRAIPPGVFFLTLDADGHARQVLRLEHSGKGGLPIEIVLEEGSGLRTPHSWRGPPVEEMVGSASGSSDGGESREAPEEAEEAAPEEGRWTELEVYASDPRGGGVEGAWVEAWAGGVRVAQGRSQGSRPLSMRVPLDQGAVQLVATHGGWGEGSLELPSPEDARDGVIRMEGDLFSVSFAGDRIRRVSAIEAALQAPLSADGRRWLVDYPDGDSAAAAAGLMRGDSLLFLRRQGNGYLAVVERGRELVEISFSP